MGRRRERATACRGYGLGARTPSRSVVSPRAVTGFGGTTRLEQAGPLDTGYNHGVVVQDKAEVDLMPEPVRDGDNPAPYAGVPRGGARPPGSSRCRPSHGRTVPSTQTQVSPRQLIGLHAHAVLRAVKLDLPHVSDVRLLAVGNEVQSIGLGNEVALVDIRLSGPCLLTPSRAVPDRPSCRSLSKALPWLQDRLGLGDGQRFGDSAVRRATRRRC
jgi:hypothetical protein